MAVAASVAASHAGDAGLVAAFEAADGLDVRLTRAGDGSVLAERSLAFEASGGDVTEATLEVDLEGSRVDARLELSLLAGADRLFAGSSTLTLEAGGEATVEVPLEPVAARLELRDEPLAFTALDDSVGLHATMLFATGDTLGGVQPGWSSDDPAVVEVLADGTVVSRGAGETLVRAAYTGAADSVAASVDLNDSPTATIEVPSADTTVAGGDSVTFQGSGTDPEDGTLTGGSLAWASDVDGSLGTGGAVTVLLSSDTIHRVTLTATDGAGATHADTVSVGVTAGGLAWQQVSAGSFHACGVAGDGTVYCWGYNLDGQLGDGTTTQSSTPVQVSGGLSWQQVSAGATHTCGVAGDGTAYCWGSNSNGELGDGTTTDSSTPVQVTGGLTWQQVSAGARHTCGVAGDGTAYCWGSNRNGQLGDGTTTDRSTPVQVSGGLTWQRVSAGSRYACGVAGDGTAHCWGSNVYGQLGDGTTNGSSTPVQVTGGLSWEGISAGGNHACGVAGDGTAHCWGYNFYGQLGDGTTTDSSTPVQVSGGLTWQQVSGGFFHTCGVAGDGTAHCWGENTYGELGDGTTTDSPVPVEVSGGMSWQKVSAGYDHTCGLDIVAAAWCWGDNSLGQLGVDTVSGSLTPVQVAHP